MAISAVLLWACSSVPAAPELIGVEPARVANDADVALRIRGNNFVPEVRGNLASPDEATADVGFAATLRAGGAVFALGEVRLLRRTELSAELAAGLQPGRYDLVVEDPRGRRAELDGGLEVYDPSQQGVRCDPGDPCADVDPCTTSERCENGWCVYGSPDRDDDGDGHVDAACGGDDCDDSPATCGAACYPGNLTPDLCDGEDLDCDGSDCRDADGDTVIDPLDVCPGEDDRLDGDADTVPDGCDACPGEDDRHDSDGDGTPDGCDTCTSVHDPAWWDPAYAMRRPLSLAETAAGDLPAAYSVVVTLDTAALVLAGELRSDGNDLRVVRHAAGSSEELDRRLVHFDTTGTQVWFATATAVSGTDATYFLYYGNATAAPAPAHWADQMGAAPIASSVYLAADDFETDVVASAPSGWVGSARYRVEDSGNSQILAVDSPDGPADYLFAGDYAWTDIVISARFSTAVTSGSYNGLWLRAATATDFQVDWFGLANNSTFQVWAGSTISSPSATGMSGGNGVETWGITPSAGTAWHDLEVRMRGQSMTFLYDGEVLGSHNFTSGASANGRFGLCAGYEATRVLWDDVVVRRYVSPEPVVTLGAVEQYCL